MSHPANDILVESIQDTLDRLEGDNRHYHDVIEAMAPVVEASVAYIEAMTPVVDAAIDYIHACHMAHHGPYADKKKAAQKRLFNQVDRYLERDL